MIDHLLVLLREARADLNAWATAGLPCNSSAEARTLELVGRIDVALAEPERKCGTCEYHRGCNVQLARAKEVCVSVSDCADWFCADWQRKEGK